MKIESRSSKRSAEWNVLVETENFELDGKNAGKVFEKMYSKLLKKLKEKAKS